MKARKKNLRYLMAFTLGLLISFWTTLFDNNGNGVLFPMMDEPESSTATTTTTTAMKGLSYHKPSSASEMATLQSTSTTTSTTTTNAGLYYCGWAQTPIAQQLFPDYAENFLKFYDNLDQSPTDAMSSEDILIFGMHGPCQRPLTEFPGKILFVNGESRGDMTTQQHPNYYQIGFAPDSDHSVLVYFVALALLKTPEHYWPRLLDPTQKAINTQKHKAAIYVSRNCVNYREVAVKRISTRVLPVHFGSKCQGANNAAIPMPSQQKKPQTNHWGSLMEIYQDYSFCIVMENTNKAWYITEKILTAFLAGCIPIYYGTTEIFDIFHKDAFVYYNTSNPQPALDQLKDLVDNPNKYEDMLRQPILAHGEQTIRDYFSLSDKIGRGELKTKIRQRMGLSS